jgi:hypothetical protein
MSLAGFPDKFTTVLLQMDVYRHLAAAILGSGSRPPEMRACAFASAAHSGNALLAEPTRKRLARAVAECDSDDVDEKKQQPKPCRRPGPGVGIHTPKPPLMKPEVLREAQIHDTGVRFFDSFE